MLPKPKRLNLKKDFKWVAAGKKLETKYLKLFVRLGDNHPPAGGPKIGIATSSKSFKKATERNRARRIASGAFEVLYSKLPKSINIVALPKSGINEVKSDKVLLDLEERLKNEKIIY